MIMLLLLFYEVSVIVLCFVLFFSIPIHLCLSFDYKLKLCIIPRWLIESSDERFRITSKKKKKKRKTQCTLLMLAKNNPSTASFEYQTENRKMPPRSSLNP